MEEMTRELKPLTMATEGDESWHAERRRVLRQVLTAPIIVTAVRGDGGVTGWRYEGGVDLSGLLGNSKALPGSMTPYGASSTTSFWTWR
jgi:hypothetical protein